MGEDSRLFAGSMLWPDDVAKLDPRERRVQRENHYQYQRERRAAARAVGLCGMCGKGQPRPSRKTCDKCIYDSAHNQRKRRNAA